MTTVHLNTGNVDKRVYEQVLFYLRTKNSNFLRALYQAATQSSTPTEDNKTLLCKSVGLPPEKWSHVERIFAAVISPNPKGTWQVNTVAGQAVK